KIAQLCQSFVRFSLADILDGHSHANRLATLHESVPVAMRAGGVIVNQLVRVGEKWAVEPANRNLEFVGNIAADFAIMVKNFEAQRGGAAELILGNLDRHTEVACLARLETAKDEFPPFKKGIVALKLRTHLAGGGCPFVGDRGFEGDGLARSDII